MDVPLHKNCTHSRAGHGEQHALDFKDAAIAWIAHSDCDARVRLILELGACGHNLGPCLADDPGANRNVEGIFNQIDAKREEHD